MVTVQNPEKIFAVAKGVEAYYGTQVYMLDRLLPNHFLLLIQPSSHPMDDTLNSIMEYLENTGPSILEELNPGPRIMNTIKT
ncbi:hypothetical protein A3K63_01230 [Candidatus Micrarchaeota archaeon RBG_16_49_10]|nr:MAG: hypothetical protein A3K63_01230 [Candidatus Micrarchaeota archaeon RBG_16_49_10]